MNKPDLNNVTDSVLNRIEKNEKQFRLIFWGLFLVELSFLVAFVLLADFNNRVHLLLFLSTIAIYSIIGIGLMALGNFIRINLLKLINVINK